MRRLPYMPLMGGNNQQINCKEYISRLITENVLIIRIIIILIIIILVIIMLLCELSLEIVINSNRKLVHAAVAAPELSAK